MKDLSKFKASNGSWITSGLFKETAQLPDFILYTLEECREWFLECKDPTGYTFANKYLGGWPHWLALQGSPKVMDRINKWLEELEVKIKAEALQNIIKAADDEDGKNNYQAAKYLLEGGWKDKGDKVGRPSKEDIKREAQKIANNYSEFRPQLVK